MAEHVCPPWIGYLLASPLRRLVQQPEVILGPYVTAGMCVLEIGPGMGFFSLPLAHMVGPAGKVYCVDVQEAMLRAVGKRAQTAQLAERIVLRRASSASLEVDDLAGTIDFALVFAVVHEVPDVAHLFADISRTLKPGAGCLVAEPTGHVKPPKFAEELALAAQSGLAVVETPRIAGSHTALLRKSLSSS